MRNRLLPFLSVKAFGSWDGVCLTESKQRDAITIIRFLAAYRFLTSFAIKKNRVCRERNFITGIKAARFEILIFFSVHYMLRRIPSWMREDLFSLRLQLKY